MATLATTRAADLALAAKAGRVVAVAGAVAVAATADTA